METAHEKGIHEGKEIANYDAARRMKNDGMLVELIAKYTGLTAEEIEKM